MSKIPEKCPSCQSDLYISQLTCSQCGTQVSGRYEPNIFSRLAPTDLNFVVMFVRARGNVKEMERELGISYWTIRRKLDEIVEQLGLLDETSTDMRSARRVEVLERLRAGEIDVDQAADLLEQIKREE